MSFNGVALDIQSDFVDTIRYNGIAKLEKKHLSNS